MITAVLLHTHLLSLDFQSVDGCPYFQDHFHHQHQRGENILKNVQRYSLQNIYSSHRTIKEQVVKWNFKEILPNELTIAMNPRNMSISN